jgi:protein-disulfide isomerase
MVGGGAILVVALIVILALGQKRTPSKNSTPVAITPIPRPQANGLAMGNPEAAVRIDVWEDFQCPMCVYYTEDVERKLIDTYIAQGKVFTSFTNIFIDLESRVKNRGVRECQYVRERTRTFLGLSRYVI